MSSVSRFLRQEKKQAGMLISLTVALGTVGGLLLIAQAWLLASVINDVIFDELQLNDVMPYLWGMLIILAVRSAIVYVTEQVAFKAAAIVKQSLRERLYQKLVQLGPAYLANQQSGELATVITDGVEALEAYYAKYLPAMSLAALLPLSILFFVFPVDWQSAAVMLVTAPLIPFFMVLIGSGAERLNQKQWRQLQRMGGYFVDVIRGLTTLKLFNASQREANIIAKISDDYRIATMKVLRVAFLSALALEFFATVSIAIVAVLIGFRLLFGEMPFFNGFFVLLLAPEFYLPLRSLGTHYHSRMNAIGAAEKMLEILNQKLPQQPEHTQDTELLSKSLSARPVSVKFDSIDFCYEPDLPVLQNFNLHIHAGETIAIVGPSGSGKTTISNLLLGFLRPQQGHLFINETDLNSIDLADWHKHVSWVPQQPRVFHGTVADNITLGQVSCSIQAIERAAKQSNAMEFINSLPEGFQTVIGEGGRGLSGGQIQRLVLARAFLRNTPFILLDEATANLDAENESLLQEAINRLSRERTMLVIAHRLSTVRHADRIIVLEDGKISQSGSHDNLIREPGLYRQLILAQGVAV